MTSLETMLGQRYLDGMAQSSGYDVERPEVQFSKGTSAKR